MELYKNCHSVDAIEWDSWHPVHTATCIFVAEEDRLLLIRKKRGLGEGKINAAGGKLEPGETPEACACREIKEELGITVSEVIHCGENLFQFADGYSMHVHIFITNQYEGQPIETDEAIPLWVDIDNIPYSEMWEDDYLWIPLMLKKKPFKGHYIFDGDKMLDHRLRTS